jgi:hypothetical protein
VHTSLWDVHDCLRSFISEQTIIVGHSVDSDLKVTMELNLVLHSSFLHVNFLLCGAGGLRCMLLLDCCTGLAADSRPRHRHSSPVLPPQRAPVQALP